MSEGKKRFLKSTLLVCFVVVTATAALAQDYKNALVAKDTVTVGTSGSAPPFSMIAATGDLEGFDIDVVNMIAKSLGVTAKFEKLDFSGLLPGLSAGRFDVIASGVTRQPSHQAI